MVLNSIIIWKSVWLYGNNKWLMLREREVFIMGLDMYLYDKINDLAIMKGKSYSYVCKYTTKIGVLSFIEYLKGKSIINIWDIIWNINMEIECFA